MSIKRRIQCIALAVLVLFFAGIGFNACAGQWAAFNKSSNFIANIGGKYIGGVVFWILGGIVSPIALTLDVFIFNVIEFWTGKNIIASGKSFEQIDENGNRITAVKNEDGSLSVRVTEVTGEITDFVLEREEDNFRMFDADGELLSSYTLENDESVN